MVLIVSLANATVTDVNIYSSTTIDSGEYGTVNIYDSQAAASYYGQSLTERHFGLGNRDTVDVKVEFYPSGRVVWKRNVSANKAVKITELP